MSFVIGSVVIDGEPKEVRSVVSREISIEKVGVRSKDPVAVTGAFFVVGFAVEPFLKQGGFEGVEKHKFRWRKDASDEECFKLWDGVCF